MREHNKISIEGAFGLERLTGFEAHVRPGKHARAVIEGIAGKLIRWRDGRNLRRSRKSP